MGGRQIPNRQVAFVLPLRACDDRGWYRRLRLHLLGLAARAATALRLFFFVLSSGWMRAWKGRAMSDEVIARVPSLLSPTILAELRMQEMPARVFSASK